MILNRCALVAVLTLSALSCGSAFAAVTGQYLFEEGSGTTAIDTSGNARNGTFAGTTGLPTYVSPGLYTGSNSALRLNSDGATLQVTNAQKVTLPGSTNFITNATGATLTGWMKLEGTLPTNLNYSILSISNGDPAAQSGNGADSRA